MKKYKNLIIVFLTTIAIACLAAVFILLITGVIADRQAEESVESLRELAEAIETTQDVDVNVTEDTDADSGETAADNTSADSVEADENETSEVPAESETETTESISSEPSDTLVTNPYRDSFLANKDMAGWLQIPGTVIDYPIMWTPQDENYYLYRDFDGSENKNGCLILDTDSSVNPLSTNLIIHGHNMRSGAMFGNLTDYESEDYYKEHKQITLYTEECKRNYEVIAVFRSQVYKKSDSVFKYYKFFQADTQEEFDDFYQNIKALSQYDTGVTAQFGDHFITLSTCVYHVDKGRFVVVAKEVENGDSYLPIEE